MRSWLKFIPRKIGPRKQSEIVLNYHIKIQNKPGKDNSCYVWPAPALTSLSDEGSGIS